MPIGHFNWRLIFGAWGVVALLLLGRTILQFGAVPLLGDTDDAMRMVTATDLLDGQAWQDPVEYRDNAPYGAQMHWSRLVDAPLALLMALTRGAGAAQLAPDIAAIVWPLLLLLPLMALLAAISRSLIPEADPTPAVILPVISLVVLIEFLPGRVDHHGIQILLCLLTVLALLAWRRRTAGGVTAGLAIATSLAIGIEALPYAAVAILAYGLFWVADPQAYRKPLIAFALALAAGTLIHFLVATVPARYSELSCDALALPSVGATALVGLALLAAALLAGRIGSALGRFLILAALGVVALGMSALLFPSCLAGPYAGVDARVVDLVFTGIAEMQSLPQRLAVDPATGIAFALAALVALPIGILRVVREQGERRVGWLVLLAFLAMADAILLVQLRGARFAGALALPMGVWLITAARQLYLARPRLPQLLGLIGSWLLFAGVAQFTLVAWLWSLAGPGAVAAAPACRLAGDYRELASLPPGTVMAPTLLGPYILRYTPHAIVSAGFHRNNEGTLDVLDFFAGPEPRARGIANARGIPYVATCGTAPPSYDWLTPLGGETGAIRIYRIAAP